MAERVNRGRVIPRFGAWIELRWRGGVGGAGGKATELCAGLWPGRGDGTGFPHASPSACSDILNSPKLAPELQGVRLGTLLPPTQIRLLEATFLSNEVVSPGPMPEGPRGGRKEAGGGSQADRMQAGRLAGTPTWASHYPERAPPPPKASVRELTARALELESNRWTQDVAPQRLDARCHSELAIDIIQVVPAAPPHWPPRPCGQTRPPLSPDPLAPCLIHPCPSPRPGGLCSFSSPTPADYLPGPCQGRERHPGPGHADKALAVGRAGHVPQEVSEGPARPERGWRLRGPCRPLSQSPSPSLGPQRGS